MSGARSTRVVQVAFTAPNRVELVETPMPVPAAGEVLIESEVSLISAGTELTLLSGEGWSPLATPGRTLPAVGYSHVGTVVELGAGVDRRWLGQRVASRSFHASHVTCRVEPTTGAWRSGLFAIPDVVSSEEATLFALGVTALHGLVRGGLQRGERVAVIGLGLLGQLVARGALRLGASRVLAIGRGAERLAFLPRHDAVQALSTGVEGVLAERGDLAVDVAFEVSGDSSAVAPSLSLVRPEGRLVLLGSSRSSSTLDLHALCVAPSRTIIGAQIASLPAQPRDADPWCVQAAARLFFDEPEPIATMTPSLVSHRFDARDAATAYEHLRARPTAETTMGCVLRWNRPSSSLHAT